MQTKFSPSINIIRDLGREINYTVTPNAVKVAHQIGDLFKKGFHCFSIIGSYGTGKSSFLWAFERTLNKQASYFKNSFKEFESIEIINIVGQPDSLQNVLAEKLGIPKGKRNSKHVLNSFQQELSNEKLTILVVDEFGKFLEYAVRNKVDDEIYFLQQLAELINTPDYNCLLITTLHQSFDAYGHHELNDGEKNEWRKVKGRFKDLTFNEPIEQLLLLAANRISSDSIVKSKNATKVADLQKKFHLVHANSDFVAEVAEKLWPLDVLSAYLLCVSLQRYGQNERSLFTFLESEFSSLNNKENEARQIGIPEIHDYLFHEFYSYLSSKYNVDYSGWAMMDLALSRIDVVVGENHVIAEDLVKIIGLITLFGHKGAHLESDFLIAYLGYQYEKKSIQNTIEELERIKVIRFNRYSRSYKIFEGTDLDFENEFLRVSQEIDNELDIIGKLSEYFTFPVVNAKSISYKKGTPRFFEYLISKTPMNEEVEGQIDGVINLIFGSTKEKIIEISSENNHSVYAQFLNVEDIRNSIFEIEKTQRVLAQNKEDKVAVKELQNILRSQKSLLNHQVIDALFSNSVKWYYLGENINIASTKELNKQLSHVCEIAYPECPTFRNELINRHLMSGNIGNAKKQLFASVVANHHLENLGFDQHRFPAEKTIYLTLLKFTGVHAKRKGAYSFGAPEDEEFLNLWNFCEAFLESAKDEKQSVENLFELLSQKPFKLTQGFLDLWVPIFFFIKRDDFALYSKGEGYLSEITDSILYLFTRTAKDYEIKTFNVQGVKLDLFNKYREFLILKDSDKVNNKSLIESIKPFLVFHKDLNPYARTTKRLTKETLDFRNTIVSVQDPEQLFFEHFPKALNTEINELLGSEVLFEDYINKLRSSIKELRSCYDELVGRIEAFLIDEILQEQPQNFNVYKDKFVNRYSNLKEHMLLKPQASFLIRINSPIDDRNSWINSICQVTIGKRLDDIVDKEEEILKEKLRKTFRELDNLVSISGQYEKRVDQNVFKLQLTSFEKGLIDETILIPKEVHEETQKKLDILEKSMGENKKINLYLLLNLLKKQLDE